MVQFVKGGLLQGFNKVVVSGLAALSLAGAMGVMNDAQAQTVQVPDGQRQTAPWANDPAYNRAADLIQSTYDNKVENAAAARAAALEKCGISTRNGLSGLAGLIHRNKASGKHHTGTERFQEWMRLGNVGGSSKVCGNAAQAKYESAERTASLAADKAMTALETKFSTAYLKAGAGTAATPGNTLRADLNKQEMAKLNVCQAQELKELSGGKAVTPACQQILAQAKAQARGPGQ